MDRFRPDLALTFLPGLSAICPLPTWTCCRTCKSSIQTIAWFWLIAVRGFVQEVVAAVGDAGVDFLDFGFGLLPVVAEFDLAAHRLLIAGQPSLVALEAVERGEEIAIAEGGKACNAHVDADGAGGLWYGLLDLAFGLDADEPLARAQADGHVLDRAQHRARLLR